mgnify:CR=1 FL=1
MRSPAPTPFALAPLVRLSSDPELMGGYAYTFGPPEFTDDAFKKLPAGTVETLLKPENKEKLAAILKFHVAPGRVFSNDVLARKELKTVHGGALSASMKNGVAMINGATIVAADIDAANGVIHVIDSVLLPPAAPAKGAHVAPTTSQHVSSACPPSSQIMTRRLSARHRR